MEMEVPVASSPPVGSVIRVDGVSKHYNLWQSPSARLQHLFLHHLRGWVPKNVGESLHLRQQALCHEFHAIEHVSFELAPRESLAIIGRNGSGKSTLLQIIAGTLQPTSGTVEVKGRIAALLELGSGFNPEFTGRENVYLNAAICGFTDEQTDAKFDEILAFAEIGEFIDQPVKTYSSGMMVRLAFSVQVLLDPQILIVDEALAVGDIFFQQKCYEHMRKLVERDVSVILVTHDMSAVLQFCTRAIIMNKGRATLFDSAIEAAKAYPLMVQAGRRELGNAPPAPSRPPQPLKLHGSSGDLDFWPDEAAFSDIRDCVQSGSGDVRPLRVALTDATGERCDIFKQGEDAFFSYEVEVLRDIDNPSGGLAIYSAKGVQLHGKMSHHYPLDVPEKVRAGVVLRFCHRLELNLQCGPYTFDFGMIATGGGGEDSQSSTLGGDGLGDVTYLLTVNRVGSFQVTLSDDLVPRQPKFFGLVSLPSLCEIKYRVPEKSFAPIPVAGVDATKPDFFIVGAAKSATTSLWAQLRSHPDIFMPDDIAYKEPSYFHSTYGFEDFASYLSLFSGARPGQRIGEASTPYLSDPEVPARIHSFNSNADIVILLRNPVDRAFSLYNWMKGAGYETLPTFEAALDSEDRRVVQDARYIARPDQNFRDYLYFASGLYFDQVRRYIDVFGTAKVRVMIFEEFIRDTLAMVQGTYEFLGVNRDYVPDLEPQNRGGDSQGMSVGTRRELESRYADDMGMLAELLGRDLRKLWF